MRPFKEFTGDMRWLALWVPLALIVPNIVLSITEPVTVWSSIANILFPLGVFLMLISLWRRTGGMTLMMLPFMIFAAFQIVLLYLYGGSVIAVDMFLNVVTTNVSEATELLANLLAAMAVVILLYLPPLIWGAVALFKKYALQESFCRKMRAVGVVMTIAGGVSMFLAWMFAPGYSIVHETFPVNVISNLVEACRRYNETSRHDELSADFTYNARSLRPAEEREVYLFVIGETGRGANWQLGGYDRPTNPRLSKEEGVVFFPKSISESNTTHKSVPMLMSFVSAENFDSIAHYKSIITAFREAGFSTAFISNQEPNRSYTEHFGNEADTVIYVHTAHGGIHAYDDAVLAPVDRLLADTLRRKQLIVIHTYGSHFKYRDRYPGAFSFFIPDNTIDASRANRSQLINAYDNSIRYTDHVLASLIDRLKSQGVKSALLYASDHGEDIFDDDRDRFLHASPVPTAWQIHQATLIWLSPVLSAENPEADKALRDNALRRISPQKSLFHTAMQLAGIASPLVVDTLSLVSRRYHAAPPVYLNDLNQPLPLKNCGLKEQDLKILAPLLR